jgi:hypothetical protein
MIVTNFLCGIKGRKPNGKGAYLVVIEHQPQPCHLPPQKKAIKVLSFQEV